jgi:hypothetical protein
LEIEQNEINQEFSDSFFLEGGNVHEEILGVLGEDTTSSNKGNVFSFSIFIFYLCTPVNSYRALKPTEVLIGPAYATHLTLV